MTPPSRLGAPGGRPPRGGGPVALPAWALAALLTALAVSVAGLTFLLGRESARRETAAAPAPESAHPATGAAVPATSSAESGPGPEAVRAEAAPTERAGFDAPAPAAPPEPASANPAGSGATAEEREAVAAYFRSLDEVERDAKTWKDPQAFAQALVEQLGKGDTSGFDRLIADNQRALEALRGLAAPAACREHQQQSVRLFGEAIAQLRHLREAAAGGDAEALMALPARAQELEARAKETDAMAAALRQRFGI